MQPWKTGKLMFRLVAVGALVVAFALFGCPDDDDEDGFLVDISRPLGDVGVAAVAAEDFIYENGLTFLGVGGFTNVTVADSLTIRFTSTALGAQATVTTEEGGTATANVTFPGGGACFFRFLTGGTIPLLQATPVGQPDQGYRFDECRLEVRSDGEVTPGEGAQDGVLVLVLNGISSNEIDIDVAISDAGELIVNGVETGIVITGAEGDSE
jgi:hypothetical protein